MNQITKLTIVAGFLLLAACSNPTGIDIQPSTVEFPTYEQFQRVVDNLFGRIISNEDTIRKALLDQGVVPPVRSVTYTQAYDSKLRKMTPSKTHKTWFAWREGRESYVTITINYLAGGYFDPVAQVSTSAKYRRKTLPYPNKKQYQHVVNTLHGQELNTDMIMQAFVDLGVHPPTGVKTSRYSLVWAATRLSWEHDYDYSVAISFAYIVLGPRLKAANPHIDPTFNTSDTKRGSALYRRHF